MPEPERKPEGQPALEVTHLSKNFSDFKAVEDISLTIEKGEIFGFLGPNGAGKTTTIKMMAGLLKPDSGSITIGGHNLAKDPLVCKKITGYIPDRPYLYEKLTGRELLQFIASLYHLSGEEFEKCQRYLELFDLTDWQDHLIESYSHGMRQKLIMTSVFMLDSPLIIVDEPMVGLDPKSARIVKELFKQHARSGKTIFLSTHSLEIAEELCNRIGIILKGRLKSLGTVDTLRKEAKMEGSDLEDVFLELTGAYEVQDVVNALRS
ncbi:MAG: ABC transporter ATP-binding protein [Desulfobulbaceae bacterium]|uniref:ABC transporter ATP-binding protein n=1 Tax=Candidatus Desulfobia pelagia TaxID=2841692 RepID=A0A8J6NFA5_9BACT|nr:ABC transporter ATP-binding protein [Candidatus Desulfobia pelagia]